MPNSIGAENRIRALLFGGPKPSHPTTISGSESYINSYALPIVYSDGPDAYLVKDQTNSTYTTNRHIRAARNVLAEYGFHDTGELTQIKMGGPYNPFVTTYSRWER